VPDFYVETKLSLEMLAKEVAEMSFDDITEFIMLVNTNVNDVAFTEKLYKQLRKALDENRTYL